MISMKPSTISRLDVGSGAPSIHSLIRKVLRNLSKRALFLSFALWTFSSRTSAGEPDAILLAILNIIGVCRQSEH